MKQLSLLFITHEKALGGASKSCIEMIRIAARKHKVIVIVKACNGEVYRELKNISNIKIIVSIPYFWWKFNPTNHSFIGSIKKKLYFFNSIPLMYIIYKLRSTKIDIVHSNSSVIDIGAKIAKIKKTKHIWHLREFGEIDQGLIFIKGKEESYQFMEKHTDKFICISNSIKEYYKKYISISKLMVIYNGINVFESHKKTNKYPYKLEFLMCSSLQPGKGHLEAIKAFGLLKEKGVDNFNLTIIGKNINNYKKILLDEVSNNRLNKQVEFLEFNEDLSSIRERNDVELICSTKEPFGRVTIESMLYSNPVVVSNSGANTEIVQDGINGYIYEQGNYIDLAKKINYILKNKNSLYVIRENAYHYALKFSSERNFKEIERIYFELL